MSGAQHAERLAAFSAVWNQILQLEKKTRLHHKNVRNICSRLVPKDSSIHFNVILALTTV